MLRLLHLRQDARGFVEVAVGDRAARRLLQHLIALGMDPRDRLDDSRLVGVAGGIGQGGIEPGSGPVEVALHIERIGFVPQRPGLLLAGHRGAIGVGQVLAIAPGGKPLDQVLGTEIVALAQCRPPCGHQFRALALGCRAGQVQAGLGIRGRRGRRLGDRPCHVGRGPCLVRIAPDVGVAAAVAELGLDLLRIGLESRGLQPQRVEPLA